MKTASRLFLALALGLGLFVSSASANLAQVTTLTTTVGTIVIPGPNCKLITIQNIGSVAVNLTFDGGTTYTDPVSGKKGTDPTTSATGLGYVLAVGQTLTISTQASDSGLHKPIRAITQTGTATLNIATDDFTSTFPTT